MTDYGVRCTGDYAPVVLAPEIEGWRGEEGCDELKGARKEATSRRLLVICEERSDEVDAFA